jgi:hypothetical protein
MPYNVVNAYANLAFLLDPKYLKEVQDRYGQIYPQLQEDATIARAKRKKVQQGALSQKIRLAGGCSAGAKAQSRLAL